MNIIKRKSQYYWNHKIKPWIYTNYSILHRRVFGFKSNPDYCDESIFKVNDNTNIQDGDYVEFEMFDGNGDGKTHYRGFIKLINKL